jgi:phage antirepressor YoqD-like protein
MQSRKPIAKEFKKGVKAILKEIRKTGGYISASADETPEQIMARALKVADETLKRREQQLQMAQSQIEEQKKEIQDLNPYADYTKEVLQSDSTYTLTQVSKDLGFRSVHEFTKWAAKKDVLYRQSNMWMPTGKYSGRKFFATRTAKYFKSDGTIGSSLSTVVTEAGRAHLHTLLKRESEKGGVAV